MGACTHRLCWLLLLAHSALADIDSCTTVGVTRGASADGSTMVTHTSDCSQCDSRIVRIPARDWPAGTMRPIYAPNLEYPREVSNRSEAYMPVDGQEYMVPTGFIPEVSHTYSYWEAVYGYMNEHGLSLGESTSAANLAVDREGIQALLWIRPLTQIAMERCRTAQCAIETMGGLAERHGFFGEDPGLAGGGEVLLLADGRELWVFEITSDKAQRGAYWAARKVPEGHVVVVANNFVIRELDCEDKENFRCSAGLLQKAKADGMWDGQGKLDWMKVMGPDIRHFSYLAGSEPVPLYTNARRWRVFSRVAPSLGLELTTDPFAQPFSVAAEEKVSHRRLMDLKRDHYEGTEIDMTLGPLAGPYGTPNRAEGGKGLNVVSGQFARAISIPRTSYCTLGQVFAEEGNKDKLWFATDTPASSVFVPFYKRAPGYGESYRRGSMHKYDEKSAWWVFDFVANWMNLNYGMMRVDVEAKIAEMQDMIDAKAKEVEAAAKEAEDDVTSPWQARLHEEVVAKWRDFGRHLIQKYNDGFLNYPKVAQSIGYPVWWLETFCVDSDIRPKWAQPTSEKPGGLEIFGRGPLDALLANATPGSGSCRAPQALRMAEKEEGSQLGLVCVASSYVLIFVLGWFGGTLRSRRSAREEPLLRYAPEA